jgi:hypothetical protein
LLCHFSCGVDSSVRQPNGFGSLLLRLRQVGQATVGVCEGTRRSRIFLASMLRDQPHHVLEAGDLAAVQAEIGPEAFDDDERYLARYFGEILAEIRRDLLESSAMCCDNSNSAGGEQQSLRAPPSADS